MAVVRPIPRVIHRTDFVMQTPTHPIIVHFPVALAVLVPLLSVVASLAIARRWSTPTLWLSVIAGQALLVGSGMLALRTGEADEDRVERIVAETIIEQHEAAAQVFMVGGGVVLALAVAAWLWRNRDAGRWLRHLTTVGTLAVAALAYRVGHSGGEIVYRHGGAAAFAASTASNGTGATPRRADHDDHR